MSDLTRHFRALFRHNRTIARLKRTLSIASEMVSEFKDIGRIVLGLWSLWLCLKFDGKLSTTVDKDSTKMPSQNVTMPCYSVKQRRTNSLTLSSCKPSWLLGVESDGVIFIWAVVSLTNICWFAYLFVLWKTTREGLCWKHKQNWKKQKTNVALKVKQTQRRSSVPKRSNQRASVRKRLRTRHLYLLYHFCSCGKPTLLRALMALKHRSKDAVD